MKGITPLVLGIFGTLAFSWLGLAYVPNLQIGHLDPQSDEEGTDIYPMPKSGMAERGRKVYVANGCFYCHSEQVRADYAASDLDRERDAGPSPRPKWGERRSAPRDYILARPVLLGKMRVGPDLSNIGKAAPAEDQSAPANASPAAAASPAASAPATAPASTAPPGAPAPSPAPSALLAPGTSPSSPAPSASPTSQPLNSSTMPVRLGPQPYSAAWHHVHLYSPRSLNLDSDMPAYRFLYDKRRVGGQPAEEALKLSDKEAPGEGWEIVPSYDAKCLVAYLMSLDQSHSLKEVKSTTPPSPPAPAKTAK
jgi:cbb3-type cytochrome oxidase cytochrome c subunit